MTVSSGRGQRRRQAARRRRPSASAASARPRATRLYYFDRAAADRACDFFPRYLVHIKGEWSGQPFELADWQRREIIRPLFGWKRRSDTFRRYDTAYVEVSRKNGKSILAAGIGLICLFCDDEPGAEVYSAARDRPQAAIVFDLAAQMVRASRHLEQRAEVYRRQIFVPSSRSTYQVLSADVLSKHGLNPHGIIFDELHVQDSRDLWDTLRTGRGARRQSITFTITTAGVDKKTLCGELHDKALAIIDGTAHDDRFLPVVYALKPARGEQPGESWESRETWRRVNPNLGVSIKETYLEGQYIEAKESPAYQNTFRRLHLCEWVSQAVRWIDARRWGRCTGPLKYAQLLERLKGKACFGGLDLSTVTDLSAFVLIFNSAIGAKDKDYPAEREIARYASLPTGWEYGDPLPRFDVLSWFWCPSEGIRQRSHKDRVPYDTWRDAGHLVATEGDAVDHGKIRVDINALGRDYLVQEIAVDQWNAHKLITELEQEDGFIIARTSQGYATMSAPTKELDTLYRRRQIRHGGHPVLAWCADNVSLDKDAHDNWKPSKRKSRERIDGIVALVMAIGRSMLGHGAIEDNRGIDAI